MDGAARLRKRRLRLLADDDVVGEMISAGVLWHFSTRSLDRYAEVQFSEALCATIKPGESAQYLMVMTSSRSKPSRRQIILS